MSAAADTTVRKPTATQNKRSDAHQPVIKSVAITAVAQPLTIAATAVAAAAFGPGALRPLIDTGLARGM